jgi:predicted Zn-dependent protease
MTDRIAQLKKLLDAEPNDPFCLYGLAQEYAKAGDLDAAVEMYERTIEADPDYCYAYYHLARVHEERDDIDRAHTVLQTGLERAQALGDAQAVGEISAYLDQL